MSYKQKKAHQKAQRLQNLKDNTATLEDLYVEFESHDEGRLLNLTKYGVQFSPSTEKWYDKWGKERFGMKGLIEYMKREDRDG
jgi:hypothetical protein|tara:strand:+ start:117 stop:365 length:249 start_codon:yes stop_codon:yes gene_type:complete